MKIRQEEPKDYKQVEALMKKAFWNGNAPGCNEHYVAHCLRRHPDFIPELSLVLEEEKPNQREQIRIRSDRLNPYFPKDYTDKQKIELIEKLVKEWHQEQMMPGNRQR